MKNLLFIGGTHGNESIGVDALRDLETRSSGFDWIIGNPRAFEAGTREFEGDLNRSAPGDLESPQFAKRRAAEIMKLSQEYRWTIDLHGTISATDIFIIITNPKPENIRLARRLRIPNIVFWPSFSSELFGPLSEYVPCGLEIECGPKDVPRVREQLVSILEDFIQRTNIDPEADDSGIDPQTTFYEVYGSLKDVSMTDALQDFVEINLKGEAFFPLLVGRYQERNGITCYKMRLIEDPKTRFQI